MAKVSPGLPRAFTTGGSTRRLRIWAPSAIGFSVTLTNASTAGAHLTVTLNETDTNGIPGAVLCTLKDPSSFASSAVELLRGAARRVPLLCDRTRPTSWSSSV